jgi:sigma-B regulation protein RsbU (phosphoserine phosphatase)
MIYGIFDIHSSTLRFAQAGHPSPILMRSGKEPLILGSGGMPVGLWPEIDFDCFEVPVAVGDQILLYSDGVTECVGTNNQAFGEERLMAYLRMRQSLTLEELLEGLLIEISAWRGNSEFADDISLLAIEISGESKPLRR